MKKSITLKHLLLIAFLASLTVSIILNANHIGGTIFVKDNKEKKANDSLAIVKLKLEIELLKLETRNNSQNL